MNRLILASAMTFALSISPMPTHAKRSLSFSADSCLRAYVSPNETMKKSMLTRCEYAARKENSMIAQAIMGNIYGSGIKGVSIDYGKAISWYQKAIDQGHVPSKVKMGRLYMLGYGVNQDFDQALELLNEGIDNQSGEAAFYRSALETLRQEAGESVEPMESAHAICKYNLIAMDYGYQEAKPAFNRFVKAVHKHSPGIYDELIQRCQKEVRAHHAMNSPILLFSNAGVSQPKQMMDDVFPIHTPQFWLSLFSKKEQ